MTRPLSEQQLTVLCWVAGGATGAEIADELDLTVTSVNNSLYEARLKLAAKNTTHLVAIAYQRSILEIETPPVTRWALPEEPGPEVTHVRDRSGRVWRRPFGGHGRNWSYEGRIGCPWPEIIGGYGPLTDVSEEYA